jgi:hypothetical protein
MQHNPYGEEVNEPIYAAPQVDLSKPTVEVGDRTFYVVSLRKFWILFVATLGMYQVYWFYKNWSRYKEGASADNGIDGDIWPVPRAIFAVFFVHSLFREIAAHATTKQRLFDWRLESHATGLVVMMLASNVLSSMSNRSIGSPLTDILNLLILLPLLYSSYRAQWFINASCGDPQGNSNSQLTAANWAWIVAGGIFWLLIAASFFMPEAEV